MYEHQNRRFCIEANRPVFLQFAGGRRNGLYNEIVNKPNATNNVKEDLK